MACRVAGGNDSPTKLWEFLMSKSDASGEIDRSRWEPWSRRDTRNAEVLANLPSRGYFLANLDHFDNTFFGISPKEAEQMDPQQRISLEVTWEALENAGIDPKSLAQSNTAVFMGIDSDDYSRLVLEDLPNIEAYMGIGTSYHGVANRISYQLDLMGPSVAVDAACASSLVAIHQGKQAISSGESDIAIVGGVNVVSAPPQIKMLQNAGVLSEDGVCRSFDDNAHGYARGEGSVVIILKKLSLAEENNDNILAVLKGSAVAQDGKTDGIFAPNANAQALVARQALQRAEVDPSSVGYVEAHATSTSLGDPTEVKALSSVYGSGNLRRSPVMIGSIKPNVGHLEAAAGAIGFLKTVMATYKGQIPPQARLKNLNSRVDWEAAGIKVVQEPTEWLESESRRRAAICSYGYGGTVSHAVIEQYPTRNDTQLKETDKAQPGGPTILVLSAPKQKRLAQQVLTLAEWLTNCGKEQSLHTIANTLALRRSKHEHRLAFIADDRKDAIQSLQSVANISPNKWTISGKAFDKRINTAAVWVFSGHGAQWPDMGKDLVRNSVFRNAVIPLEQIILEESGFSAMEALETGDFEDTERIQVLTYLVQIGLSRILKTKGSTPAAIIGHSFGEIAAAVVGGCLTEAEGAIIVTRRARLYRQFQGLGAMALVYSDFAQVAAETSGLDGLVAAIESSPSTCVVSGEIAALRSYLEGLAVRGVRSVAIKTDLAFHSPMLQELALPLKDSISNAIKPHPSTIPIYSTSDAGRNCRSSSLRGAEYWVNNMLNTVWLRSAVESAVEDGYRIFLEISSHPIVLSSINETLAAQGVDDFATIATMRRNTSAEKSVLAAIAELYVRGSPIDFTSMFGTAWCPDVPGFQWSHDSFWREVQHGPLHQAKPHDPKSHSLIGSRTVIAGTDVVFFSTKLDEHNKPYPGSHPLGGTEIIPAAVYLNTFRQATGCCSISQIKLDVSVAITKDKKDLQVVVEGDKVHLATRLEEHNNIKERLWTIHSSCRSDSIEPCSDAATLDIAAIQKRIGQILPRDFALEYLEKIGVEGLAFPWIVIEHYGNSKEMLAKVDVDPESNGDTQEVCSWAPLLDAATSVGATIFFDDPRMRIVSQIDRVSFYSDRSAVRFGYLFVEEATDSQSKAVHVSVLDQNGEILVRFQSMRFSEIEVDVEASRSVENIVHQISWVPARLSEKTAPFNTVIFVSDNLSQVNRYSDQLHRTSGNILHVTHTKDLDDQNLLSSISDQTLAVIYIPKAVGIQDEVAAVAEKLIMEVVGLIKIVFNASLPAKLFVITERVFQAETPLALAQAPLYGLARIAAVEHPDIWGGLIDNDNSIFPLLAIKYVQGEDVIRVEDGLPRIARLQPMPQSCRYPASGAPTLLPKRAGTYVITGGLGDLGLEVCNFLVQKGACRILLISRRALPARKTWDCTSKSMAPIIQKIKNLEECGATIQTLSLDIAAEDAHEKLLEALDWIGFPPVLGVVHAAGVVKGSLIRETDTEILSSVLAPKVSGALAIHKAFPAGSLDFFVLFSSIGQLVGAAGQCAYACGNAFLDGMARYRREQGENAIAIQWTAWRNLGMAQDSKFVELELLSKGIADVSPDEAFGAWEFLNEHDTDHAVVAPVNVLEPDEPLPVAILEQVAIRRTDHSDQTSEDSAIGGTEARNPSWDVEQFKAWVLDNVSQSLAAVIGVKDVADIDPKEPFHDLGVDSMLTITLRQKLQAAFKIKIPPTITWKHPTVNDLSGWVFDQMRQT